MTQKKTHLYFVPGLGAGSHIFEHLTLDPNKYECHYLEWLIPTRANENLMTYAMRLADAVKEPMPVLIGVSFGGILVQEMARLLKTDKVIIISSVKSEKEFPKRVGFAKMFRIYRLFPSKYLRQIELFVKDKFGKKIKKRIELYEKYQTVLDPKYLNWAFYTILHWEKNYITPHLYHIHGEADKIFPTKYISNYIPVKKGTHIMILNKAKEISKILQEII